MRTSEPTPDGRVEITKEGDGAHQAGHVWVLKVDGKFVGTYQTRKQAQAAAERDAR